MIYLDTCYILKCYLTELGSPEVRELVSEAEVVASSAHARVEFVAAVHRHLREGRLTPNEMDAVLQVFDKDCDDGYWQWLPMTDAVLSVARTTLRTLPSGVFLRSGDALHLACAQHNGFTEVFTNDRWRLARADVVLVNLALPPMIESQKAPFFTIGEMFLAHAAGTPVIAFGPTFRGRAGYEAIVTRSFDQMSDALAYIVELYA